MTETTLLTLDPKVMVVHSAETAGICDRLAKVQNTHITTMRNIQPIVISHGQAINAAVAMTRDFEQQRWRSQQNKRVALSQLGK